MTAPAMLPRRLITLPAALLTLALVVLGVRLGASDTREDWGMYPGFWDQKTALALHPNEDSQQADTLLNFDLEAPSGGVDEHQADLLKVLEEKQVAAALFTLTINFKAHAYAIYDPSGQVPWLKDYDITPSAERKAILISGSACDLLWQNSKEACDLIPEGTEILGSVDAPEAKDRNGDTQYLLIPATSDPILLGTLLFNEKPSGLHSEVTQVLEGAGYSVSKTGISDGLKLFVLSLPFLLVLGLVATVYFYWRKTKTDLETRLARSKIISGSLIGWVIGGILTYLHYDEPAGEKIFIAAVSFIVMVVLLQVIYPKPVPESHIWKPTESTDNFKRLLPSWIALWLVGMVFIGGAASLASYADGPRNYYHKGAIHEALSERNAVYFQDVVGKRDSESRPTEALATLATLIDQKKAYAVGYEKIEFDHRNDPAAKVWDDYMARPQAQFYLVGDQIREIQTDTDLCDPAPCAMSGDKVRGMPKYLDIAGHSFDLLASPSNAKGRVFVAERSYRNLETGLLVRLPSEDLTKLDDEAARAVLLGTIFTGASDAEINQIIREAVSAGVVLEPEHYLDVRHSIYTPIQILSQPSLWFRLAALALLGMFFFSITRQLMATNNIHPLFTVAIVVVVGIVIPTLIAPWTSLFMNGEPWAALVYPCAIVGLLVLVGVVVAAGRAIPDNDSAKT